MVGGDASREGGAAGDREAVSDGSLHTRATGDASCGCGDDKADSV